MPEVWVIDDVSFPKCGNASAGVARQYCGALGKRANCQVAVSVHAATDTASCPLEWQLYLPREWKNGDVAACRECVGYRVSYTYSECGCTAMVTPEAAAKRKTRCWNCYEQWYRDNEPRIKAGLSAAARTAADRAGELLDAVPLPEDMPAPLAAEWRRWASRHLQGAIAAEEVLGKAGAREDMLSSVSARGARLLPSTEDAGWAAAADGVLRLLDQAHWAQGWLHVRTRRTPRPVPEEDFEGVAIILGNTLADWSQGAAAAVARDRANGHRPSATAEITRSLTQSVASFRDENVIGPIAKDARVYRELRVPVVPDGKSRFGRLDGVVWLPGLPDLVVEIDSRPNPASAQKPIFARDAGACPLWVRFGTGGVEKIEGVTVLDIRDIVQAVLDPGTE